MKKTKALSIALAALTVSAVAASVSAADYYVDPGYELPDVSEGEQYKEGNTNASPAPTPGTGSSEGSTSASKAKPSTTLSNVAVDRAINSGKAVKASYQKAAIKSSSMAALAKKADSVLKVETARYSISIKGDSVTDAKNIDLGMKITKDSGKGALIIRTAQAGSYGCTVSMSVPAKIYEQAGVDLSKAAIYSINVETGEVVKLQDVEVDADGNIVFDITDGGTYVIL